MADYKVTWEIDAENQPSPKAAAEFAWAAMRRPGSWANVFTVSSKNGTWRVDLEDGTTELLAETLDEFVTRNEAAIKAIPTTIVSECGDCGADALYDPVSGSGFCKSCAYRDGTHYA